mmetsp:Transcript_118266/g.331235  ORF Transcript_118266/g.331235 Transcript_118266/m.331235 type:complete len:601 (-) Transcript_118266:84-1886(-)
MPAVSVLPLGSTAIGSPHQVTDARLLQAMASPDGMPEAELVQHSSGTSEDPAKISSGDEGPSKAGSKDGADLAKPLDSDKKDSNSAGGTVSPSQSSTGYPVLPSHLTPQHPGYYVAYQSQVTPEPPSPAGQGGNPVYDPASFLQQPTGFSQFTVPQFTGAPVPGQPQAGQAPPSPSQNSIPPPSPLFPRPTGPTAGLLDPGRMLDGSGGQHRGAPLSPGPPYLSQALGPSGAMYPGMNIYGSGASENGSTDGFGGWGDSRNHQISPYPQHSPQISAQGIPIPYVPGMPPRSASAANRSYSFEDSMMLTPSVESQQQMSQDQYSVGQHSPGAGGPGNSFAHQQAWGYPGPPPDMYGASASPLQPRPTMSYNGMPLGPPRHHGPPQMAPPYVGQFFPATSPGPPIQTTASNKGPDGANLFIFHIPNHFTNLDMYQLFCPYGNLLSVRIMVEKDSGRSRGFGFVSYDSPESAALAIKELNGFAVGNKRLKVQHKQIRSSDQHNDRNDSYSHHSGFDDQMGGGQGRGQMLPPSGAMMPGANNIGWFVQQGGAMPDPIGVNEEAHDGNSGAPEGNSTNAAVVSGSDPLSGLEPLRQALPDVGSDN